MEQQEVSLSSNNELTRGKLIMSALEGKLAAIAGYDSILWKIRAGYGAILYGSLALILGTSGIPDFRAVVSELNRVLVIFLLLIVFSLSAYVVDKTYLTKKLKVIVTRDRLMAMALTGMSDADTDDLQTLLSISGELPVDKLPKQVRAEFRDKMAASRTGEHFPIYGVPPLLIVVIYLIIWIVG
jgi:hypothetical protein